MSAAWRGLFITGLFLGFLAGCASWPLSGLMSYPIATPDGPGRFAGLPFAVAFFNAGGRARS